MPSFPSFLKHPRAGRGQIDNQDRNDIRINMVNDTTEQEKEQQRKSKRHFFRNLLKRPSSNSKAKRGTLEFLKSPRNSQTHSRKSLTPASIMSNPNKPLPLPPLPSTIESESPRPTKNPQRIISPLALPELQKLFSGAPQFFARSEGHHTGAPHPFVAFPWDLEVEIRDLCDHIKIQNEAWSSITALPHITRDIQSNSTAVTEHHEKQKAHYLPSCRERPNMLSMQGMERGTLGFTAALELGVADALQEPEPLPDGYPESLSERREIFLNGKDGVRPLAESILLERLASASVAYHDDDYLKRQRPTVDLYTELFTQVLFPPSRVTDSHDPYSLQVQIEALVQALAAPVWVDFSLPEWRIRLGQILWGSPVENDTDDDIMVNKEIAHEAGIERYWLLLQILLSCELLLRLDAISINIDRGLEDAQPSDIKRFNKKATMSVRWSLILARCWLENIQIEIRSAVTESAKKAPAGWLATLTGTADLSDEADDDIIHDIQFQGRHQRRQLSGLLHFARKLSWPNAEALAAKITDNSIAISEGLQSNLAAGTPLSALARRSDSYFPTPRPDMRTELPKSQNISAVFHPSGWLSNSYISGLILPGEGLSHFMISTLLENDDAAVSTLGQEANFYGGFSYGGRSFWSTACIVGRVLAAGKGASECVGWISSDIVPEGAGEGWLDISVEALSYNDNDKRKPRIWQKTSIETDGHVIGGADTSSVLPGDFTFPSDESIQRALSIKLESLDLVATDSVRTTAMKDPSTASSEFSEAPAIPTYSAEMRFSVDADGEDTDEINLSLKYDTRFVTAHPCVAMQYTELLKSPTSSAFRVPDRPGFWNSTGHPLHKAFTYTKLTLYNLLSLPAYLPFESLLSPSIPGFDAAHSTTHTTNSTIPKVLVIDCTDYSMTAFPVRPCPSPQTPHPPKHRFGSDMEVLARALCAERGWNALISRKGRGCLACAVREAGALGWRVVLRFA